MVRRFLDWIRVDDAVDEKLGYRTASMVNLVGVVVSLAALVTLTVEIVYVRRFAPPYHQSTVAIGLAALASALIVLALNQRGYTRLASGSLLLLLWLSITIGAYSFNGLFDVSIMGFFMLMAVAGLLNGEEAVKVAAGMCLATATFLLIANPTPKTISYRNAVDLYFDFAVIVLITLFMAYVLFLLIRKSREALESSRSELAERQRAEQAEREQRELAESLRDAAQDLNRSLRLDDVLSSLLTHMCRAIPYDVASVGLIQGDRVHLNRVRAAGADLPLDSVLAEEGLRIDEIPFMRRVIASGQAEVVSDKTRLPGLPDVLKNSQQRSFVTAPIRAEGEVIGVLLALSTQPAFYTELHGERLQAFADLAASSIQNSRLYGVLQTYTADLEEMVAQATADLSAAKEQAESILEHGADGVLLLDNKGVVQVSNPAVGQMLGYSQDKALNRKLADLVPPDHADAVRAALTTAVEDGQTVRLEIVTYDTGDGPRDVDLTLTPISNEHGVVCLLHDISPLKRVERMKDAFVSIAAHELRTPLTSVLGFSEILLTRQLDAEKSRRYMQTINGQAAQLKQIIDDLLDVTRLESGRALDLQTSTVCLDKLIEDALEVFSDATADRRFTFRPAAEEAWVRADPFRLAQVLRNLISNAVKYSATGTEVEVVLRVQAGAAQVSVRDEGIGMTPAQLSHMFEKFYRSQQAIQMSTGTGLGLTISRTIIEAHGGRIWVESEPGVGSTFSFVLPLNKEDPPLLLQDNEPGSHRNRQGKA